MKQNVYLHLTLTNHILFVNYQGLSIMPWLIMRVCSVFLYCLWNNAYWQKHRYLQSLHSLERCLLGSTCFLACWKALLKARIFKSYAQIHCLISSLLNNICFLPHLHIAHSGPNIWCPSRGIAAAIGLKQRIQELVYGAISGVVHNFLTCTPTYGTKSSF